MSEKKLPADLTFSEIRIGDIFRFTRTISQKDVQAFAELTEDFNPLHVDPNYAKNTTFKKNIVHGLLIGSLFSTLVGMYCPGKKALYLSQTLNFRSPVFYGDTITVQGTVTDKSEGISLIILKTEILKDGRPVVFGEAKVKVLED